MEGADKAGIGEAAAMKQREGDKVVVPDGDAAEGKQFIFLDTTMTKF